MVVPVLCLVCFFFLCWILILKCEVDYMKKEVERIKVLLKTKLGFVEKEVEVTGGRFLRGRVTKDDPSRSP